MRKNGYLRIFVSYYRPHRKLFALDMVCAFGIAMVSLAFPYVSKLAMEQFLPNQRYTAFFVLLCALVGAYVLKAGMEYIVTYYGHLLGVRIETDMRRDLFSHMQDLSFSFFDKNRTGHLMSRVTNDLNDMTELAHHGPEDLFISLAMLAGAFVVLFSIRWELALVLLALVPLLILLISLQRKRLMAASAAVKAERAGINGDLESSLSGMRTAKAFANEDAEVQKFRAANEKLRAARQTYFKRMGFFYGGLEFLMSTLSVAVLAVGGYLIMQGRMSYIELMTFSLYVASFLTPIRKLTMFTELFVEGMAGFKRFVELMRIEPEVQDSPDANPVPSVKGDILVDDVSFRYQGGAEDVLSHVTLHVPAGETVAVVGPSGGGKSTLCQLIPRFYDVTGGRILVDGADVRSLQQRSLREHIGIVQQDVFLFAGTIRDNIRYGKPDATDEEIFIAARRAEIYDDIMDMPDGFETFVGERGVLLSGGQKQRVSIARIFLKNPPILILDEATSALDSVTEAKIQNAFDELAKGRTTLIIAHRLSTIRTAGRILVIDEAGIKEQGTHEELLELDGEYAALYRAQNSHDEN